MREPHLISSSPGTLTGTLRQTPAQGEKNLWQPNHGNMKDLTNELMVAWSSRKVGDYALQDLDRHFLRLTFDVVMTGR